MLRMPVGSGLSVVESTTRPLGASEEIAHCEQARIRIWRSGPAVCAVLGPAQRSCLALRSVEFARPVMGMQLIGPRARGAKHQKEFAMPLVQNTLTSIARTEWQEAYRSFRHASRLENYSYAAQQADPLCWLDEGDWPPQRIFGLFGPQHAQEAYYNAVTALLQNDAEYTYGREAYEAFNDIDDLPF